MGGGGHRHGAGDFARRALGAAQARRASFPEVSLEELRFRFLLSKGGWFKNIWFFLNTVVWNNRPACAVSFGTLANYGSDLLEPWHGVMNCFVFFAICPAGLHFGGFGVQLGMGQALPAWYGPGPATSF